MSTLASLMVTIGGNIKGLSDALSDAEDRISKTGEKMKSMGSGLTAGVTAPLVGIGIAAFASAQEAEKGFGKLQAATGASADEMVNLKDTAANVWKNGFGADMSEVSDNLITVKQNMKDIVWYDDGSLDQAVMDAMTLSDVFEVDVKDSTKTAAVMMKNFGIDGTKAFDLITTGFQNGGDSAGDLMDTLTEYSPQFASMGMSAEDMLGVLIKGAEAGAFNLDKVGDAVKEFNIRAVDGSKTTAEGYAAIGLKADEMAKAIAGGGEGATQAFQATLAGLAAMKDPVAQNTAGVALFGTQWEDVRSKVVLAMSEGIGSLTGFEGATSRAGAAMYDTFGDRMTALWRELQTSLAPIGSVLMDLAEKVMPMLAGAVSTVAGWFDAMSPSMQLAGIAIASIVAAIGPLLIVIGHIASGLGVVIGVVSSFIAWVGSAVSAIGLWVGGAGTFGEAMLLISGPIGWVIAAIIALIAVFATLWTTNENFRKFITDTWQAIGDFLKPAIQAISDFMHETFDGLAKWWSEMWPEMKKALTNVWDAIKVFLEPAIKFLVGVIKFQFELAVEIIKVAWDLIKDLISAAIKIIQGIIEVFTGLFTGNWEMMWNGVAKVFGGVWDGIVAALKGAINFMGAILNKFIDFFNNIKIKVPAVTIPMVGTFGGFDIGMPQIPRIPALAVGTNYVAKSGLAMIHEGEAVVPKKYNPANGSGGTATIIVDLDGETIARVVGQPLVDMIRVRTGLRI